MRKQATRKPDIKEEKLRNMKPANPKAMEMSDCTQNELVAVHVSVPLNVLANAVPADPADRSRYANT